MDTQLGSALGILDSLSDSPFHRFWATLSPALKFLVMYGSAPQRDHSLIEEPYFDASRSAVTDLREMLKHRWYSDNTVGEESSYSPLAESLFRTQPCIVLVGGPVANRIVREYLCHFPRLRYVIDYAMPRYEDIRVVDRNTGERFRASYSEHQGTRTVVEDVAVLTIMPNPASQRDRGSVVSVAGVHAMGTVGLLNGMVDDAFLSELGSAWPGPESVFQAIYNVDRRGLAQLRPDSLHTAGSS